MTLDDEFPVNKYFYDRANNINSKYTTLRVYLSKKSCNKIRHQDFRLED